MPKTKRMQYKGESRDALYNPWMRLVHGMHYDVEKRVMSSGKVRCLVSDGVEVVRITYDTKREFEKEWC